MKFGQVVSEIRARYIGGGDYCRQQDEARLAVDELPASLALPMLAAATCESSSSSLENTRTVNGDRGTGSPDHVTSTVYWPGSVTL